MVTGVADAICVDVTEQNVRAGAARGAARSERPDLFTSTTTRTLAHFLRARAPLSGGGRRSGSEQREDLPRDVPDPCLRERRWERGQREPCFRRLRRAQRLPLLLRRKRLRVHKRR